MGEIIAIIGMICCGILFLGYMINEKWVAALLWFFLFGVNCFSFKAQRDSHKSDKVEKWKTVECCKYTVDSTIVISGSDTTKTYVINYLE